MSQRILIVGAGFAGLWSALSAARVLEEAGRADGSVEIALIAPAPYLPMRPRFYEPSPETMKAPLGEIFEAARVRYVQGSLERIEAAGNRVEYVDGEGVRRGMTYDRLVLAAGSQLFRPGLRGLREYAFSIDQLEEARVLAEHVERLASRPASAARDTVVVVGGGFTGIELATELRERLHGVLGADAEVAVVLIEQADAIGPDLGAGPRPVIEQALRETGVRCLTGASVTEVDPNGVRTSGGERIEALTVVWTGGLRASPLAAQVGRTHDRVGRLHVADDLRVDGESGVFAAGDVAYAATDDAGNHALMSCQHALGMGRAAGYNVAADLLGRATLPYRQPKYVTCLDLGSWGAVFTEGWEREVKMSGAEAKALKRQINGTLIYPPPANRVALLEAADPRRPVVA